MQVQRLVIPSAMAFAAVIGWVVSQPVGAIVAAGLLGVVVDWGIRSVQRRKLDAITESVTEFAGEYKMPPPLVAKGEPEWQRFVSTLNETAETVQDRLTAVREAQSRREQLLDAIPMSILVFANDQLVYANPEAESVFEIGTEWKGRGLSPVRALGLPSLNTALSEAEELDQVVTVAVRRDQKDLMARAVRMTDEQSAMIVTDITDLRRVEMMRRDFVANASHELKTPVAGMQALADSLHLAIERDPDRAQSMVERIQTDATRLGQLVRDLLDLTRLEEGAEDRRRARVDLTELTEKTIERLETLAADHDVDLTFNKDGEVAVIGIQDDLKLIVNNLIQNAILYNKPAGSVIVDIKSDRDEAVLSVRDTGIGLAEAEKTRVFERFYRVDKARSRVSGGTGLGLSLVRHAVVNHGGRLTVDSVLGEGSTFTVRLPFDGGQ